VALSQVNNGADRKRGIEKGVIAVNVERNAGGCGGMGSV
jgi:hypothetical protein